MATVTRSGLHPGIRHQPGAQAKTFADFPMHTTCSPTPAGHDYDSAWPARSHVRRCPFSVPGREGGASRDRPLFAPATQMPNQPMKLTACGRRRWRNAQWTRSILSAAPTGRSLWAIR